MARHGRKRFLDGYKRREILAILAVGGRREVAAKYVGCCVRTIQNTADGDKDFAEKMRHQESGTEINYLENIRKAAQNERYWRAAAWALERIHPERYVARGPDVITVDQLKNLLTQFTEVIAEEIPARFRKRILKRFDAISNSLKGTSSK